MDTRKRKILLVEDDTALASVYRSRLELEGFDVCEANNGEDALSLAVSEHPDLILLDVMMPKISGFDVLDILRNTPGDYANGAQPAQRQRTRRAARC